MSVCFDARTLAYRHLAQILNRSLSELKSFIRECLDPVVKAYSCTQYVDNIGIAAHTGDEILQNIELVFHWIEFVGLELYVIKVRLDKVRLNLQEGNFKTTNLKSRLH